jgi:predicted DNA-binding transcriptional regulator AlpA
MSTIKLMGAAEIAQLLVVSPSRVHQILRDDATFPEPVAVLSMGKVWNADDVDRWNAARKAPRPARDQGKADQWTLDDLHQALDRYERLLGSSGKSSSTIHTSVDRPRRFLRWLAGEYDPLT